MINYSKYDFSNKAKVICDTEEKEILNFFNELSYEKYVEVIINSNDQYDPIKFPYIKLKRFEWLNVANEFFGNVNPEYFTGKRLEIGNTFRTNSKNAVEFVIGELYKLNFIVKEKVVGYLCPVYMIDPFESGSKTVYRFEMYVRINSEEDFNSINRCYYNYDCNEEDGGEIFFKVICKYDGDFKLDKAKQIVEQIKKYNDYSMRRISEYRYIDYCSNVTTKNLLPSNISKSIHDDYVDAIRYETSYINRNGRIYDKSLAEIYTKYNDLKKQMVNISKEFIRKENNKSIRAGDRITQFMIEKR